MSTSSTVPSRARLARARAREEVTREIVTVARRQLATEGAAALSLRAVARELGMVSSAVYRYVPGRDALLTLLIVDAYNSLGALAERREARVPRTELRARFCAIARAVRAWALAHPHEYALVYGSPVPGYAAPADTVAPASRVGVLMARVVQDGVASGALDRVASPRLPAGVAQALHPARAVIGPGVPDDLVVRALMAWTYLFGAVSFELFGHRHNVIGETDEQKAAFFEEEITRIVELVGL